MEFLKAILGDELYKQVTEKVNAFNGAPENKEKQIKLANLGEGGYVSKDKYGSLETTHNSKLAELQKANDLIAELQKSTKGNEDLQTKIQNYDSQVKTLQAELEKTKLDAAVKVALLESKATDIDYMTFKLKEKGEVKLDEHGKISGWDDKLAGLKTQFPNQFETSQNKTIKENKLPGSTDPQGITQEAFNKMGYNDRLKVYNENPEVYAELTKNK